MSSWIKKDCRPFLKEKSEIQYPSSTIGVVQSKFDKFCRTFTVFLIGTDTVMTVAEAVYDLKTKTKAK